MFVGFKNHEFFHKFVLTTVKKYQFCLTKFQGSDNLNLTRLHLFFFFFWEQRQTLAENSLSEGQIQGLMTLSYRCGQGTFESNFCSVHGLEDLGRESEIPIRAFDWGDIHIFPINRGLQPNK